jgi:DNA-directed RNA polymerase specialized sigma subunit
MKTDFDTLHEENLEEEEQDSICLKECSQLCYDNEIECDFNDCNNWINFKEDNNCDLISLKKHGSLTLRQIGDRLGISYVRVKQIEDNAIKKIKNNTSYDIEFN